jgi:IS605 OrfB family transposase
MNRRIPKGKRYKVFQGVQIRLILLKEEDERTVLDLMGRFSGAVRSAYQRLLEGRDRKELKREDGPLCVLFGLNTRYADGAIEKAQALIASAEEFGNDPRKVIFGGRKTFEQLKRKHLSGKALLLLKRKWREKRQGLLHSRGHSAKKGNANLRLETRDGALWLRVNLGDGSHVHAPVKRAHPQLNALRERAYASLPYNVTLQLKEGEVCAQFGWSEELPPPVYTKEIGVLGIDINSDLYHLALAVVSPDGNLRRHLALSPEEVDQAPDKGTKKLLLWRVAHQVVVIAEECGVAITTEGLKYLRKSRRGDGSGHRFRRKQHRFAYWSLLEKIDPLARKRGVEVLEVNPQDTSTIGMLKYAPLLHLFKDVATALVIGRRALGFEEKLPKGYKVLLKDNTFYANARGFYQSRLQEMQKVKEAEKNLYLKRRLSREMGKACKALSLLSSFPGPSGQKASL